MLPLETALRLGVGAGAGLWYALIRVARTNSPGPLAGCVAGGDTPSRQAPIVGRAVYFYLYSSDTVRGLKTGGSLPRLFLPGHPARCAYARTVKNQ